MKLSPLSLSSSTSEPVWTEKRAPHTFQQTDTHVMLGPPLPPSSSHLPPPSPLFSCSEWAPPPSSLSTHPPSDFTVHQGWLELNMWPFNEEFVAQKNCNYCRCSNSILHPSSSPCFIHTLFLWRRGGGGDSTVSLSGLNTHMCPQKADCFPSNNHPTSSPLCSPFSGSNQALLHISCHKLCRRNVDLT